MNFINNSKYSNRLPTCPECQKEIVTIRGTYIRSNSSLHVIYTCPQCSPVKEITAPIETFFNHLKPITPIPQPYCPTHKSSLLNLFCVSCEQAICLECKKNTHTHHSIKSFKEYFNQVNQSKPDKDTFVKHCDNFFDKAEKQYTLIYDEVVRIINYLTTAKTHIEKMHLIHKRMNLQLIDLAHLLYENISLVRNKQAQHISLIINYDNILDMNTDNIRYIENIETEHLKHYIKRLKDFFKDTFIMKNLFEEKELKILKTEGRVVCLLELPNDYLVSGNAKGIMEKWNLKDYSNFSIQLHNKAITGLVRVDELDAIASSGLDSTIKLFNWNTNTIISVISFIPYRISSILRLFNGQIAACSKENIIVKLNCKALNIIKTLYLDYPFYSFIQLHNGNLCIGSRKIEIRNSETFELIVCYQPVYKQEINQLYQLQNRKLVSIDNESFIIWNLELNQCETIYSNNRQYEIIYQLSNGNIMLGYFGNVERMESERHNWIAEQTNCFNTVQSMIELSNGLIAEGCYYEDVYLLKK